MSNVELSLLLMVAGGFGALARYGASGRDGRRAAAADLAGQLLVGAALGGLILAA